MEKRMKLLAYFLALLLLGGVISPAFAVEAKKVVTLGANLNSLQREKMLNVFGVQKDDPDLTIIEVTNAEERETLKGLVPLSQIGTRAISCAYVELKEEGSGITVKTKNITWVTKETYANVLVTAGVKDAYVFAAAPFPVSGTAALTGLFKAYEEATGKEIPEEAKKVAAEEMVTSGEVAEETGEPQKVSDLISEVKERVAAEGLKDPEEIRKVILEVAAKLDLDLTQSQVDRIAVLMQKISRLNLDVDFLKSQLKNVRSQIERVLKTEEARSWWEKIKQFFIYLWEKIKSYFS